MEQQTNAKKLETGPPGILGRPEVLMIAVGQVVGAGVISLIGVGIGQTGKSIWLSYLIAIVVGFFIAVPFMLLGSTLRLSGGPYSAIHTLLGERVAGMFLVGQIPGLVSMAVYCVSVGNYMKSLFPGFDVRIVGVVTLTAFYLIHLCGVDIMAKVQKYMGYILLISLMLFIIFGMRKVDISVMDFSDQDFMTNGWSGVFTAVFLLVFSTHGYYYAIGYGKDAKNARRDIPWAMLCAVPIIFVLYVGASIVAAGVLPLQEVAGQPLTNAAKAVLPAPLFIVFIVGGAMMALLTSLNSSIGFSSNMLLAGAKDGWLPESWAKTNRRGAPYVILTLIYLIGLIPVVINFDVGKITNNILLFTSTLMFITFYAIFKLPSVCPEEWKNSRMHMATWKFYLLMIVGTLMEVAVFIYSIRGVGVMVAVVSLAALVISIAYSQIRFKKGFVHSVVSVWSD